MILFGIDLGGTKIEILALDESGRERLRKRVATPAGDYAATVAAITALVHDAERELGETGSVGIATPGAVSRKTGRIKNANSTCLNGKPLVDDLQRVLQREIRIENDANCFALSEATDGAAAGAAVVFGVILGTGVGGGIVVHGRTLVGANAIAGEWGTQSCRGRRRTARQRLLLRARRLHRDLVVRPGLAQNFSSSTDGASMRRPSRRQQPAAMRAPKSRWRLTKSGCKSLASVINLLIPCHRAGWRPVEPGAAVPNVAALGPLPVQRCGGDAACAARYGDASGAAAWL
jgi:hypothetical protein